jgi:piezo-type mechanosensitive ion channel component 1/2
LRATAGVRATKQYWILEGGLQLRVASDKYTKAIFGYSVMSFYISIILVIANYFRFLFQGSVHTILTTDIPYPDPILAICNDIFRARRMHDLMR